MNTLQSNDSNELGTTAIEPTAAQLTQSAQNAARPLPTPDNRQKLSYNEERRILNWLCNNGSITDYQRDWGMVMYVIDEKMIPRLNVCAAVAYYLLDPTEYKASENKIVAIDLNKASNSEGIEPLMVGRLRAINNRYLYLSFDNVAFPELRIERKQINQIFQAIWLVGGPIQ